MTADELILILRRHLLPFVSTITGDLPSEDHLRSTLELDVKWEEWTIDAHDERDWKIDRTSNTYRVRYRGDDPKVAAVAENCNTELRLVEELQFARALVAELAGGVVTASTEIGGDPYCALCGVEAITGPELNALYDGDLSAHENDCLWARARRYVRGGR